jgi:hypothetical protein
MDEELISLIRKLRDESAFVQSEKKHLIELYKQVSNVCVSRLNFVLSYFNPKFLANHPVYLVIYIKSFWQSITSMEKIINMQYINFFYQFQVFFPLKN